MLQAELTILNAIKVQTLNWGRIRPYMMGQNTMTQQKLNALLKECQPLYLRGATADYIPILQNVDPSLLGACLTTDTELCLTAGAFDYPFSIQSIVKVIIFASCLMENDLDAISRKVSVEPTSDRFNSIKSLELNNGNRPLNPMINAGAIACLSLVKGDRAQEKVEKIRSLISRMAGREDIRVNMDIFQSEKQTGYRNRALAYYMQSTGILSPDQDVEMLLDAYFQACSISVTCVDLARIALVLAENGISRQDGAEILPKQIARILKATMMICGMYNESGHVAVHIGLPTKSGVGGGILSVVPEKMGIGIFGPALDGAGNSVAGLALLEKISRYLDVSIF